MVRWEGVEPPTFWFVARCSIQLSYQRVTSAHYKEINAGSPAVVEKHLKGFIWTPVVQEFQIVR